MAKRLGNWASNLKVAGSIPGSANDVVSLVKALHPTCLGKCPSTYCKSLWIGASVKWLNGNVCRVSLYSDRWKEPIVEVFSRRHWEDDRDETALKQRSLCACERIELTTSCVVWVLAAALWLFHDHRDELTHNSRLWHVHSWVQSSERTLIHTHTLNTSSVTHTLCWGNTQQMHSCWNWVQLGTVLNYVHCI